MAKGLIVNNDYLGATVPTVIATTGTPTQIYRNTDNTVFMPTRIIATNITTHAAHRLLLVDADLDDAGEFAYDAETYVLMDINIGASATVILNEDDIPNGLQFIYGVAGYVTNADLDVKVYIEGYEIPTTTTE